MTDLSSTPAIAHPVAAMPRRTTFRPPLPQGHVARPALCERLAAAGGHLLLLCAPAGFGKSSLAVEFCQNLPAAWKSLWLSLDRRDADAGRFLERLLEGLQLHFPEIGSPAALLLGMRQRHQPFAFEHWLEGLFEELRPCLSMQRPLLLVLDDYHLAQGEVLDACLQFLLQQRPEGLQVLVTSRQRPAWQLARMRLHGQLLELGEQDLRLSHDEAIAVLGRQASELPAPALRALIQRSEGWVAGLRFWQLAAGQAAPQNPMSQRLNGSEGLLRDYLLEEVVDRLPPDIQAFLYDTACQDRFCMGLCDAMRDSHDSAAMLAYLKAHQVFLVPLDEKGEWFRYHHLFSDLLRSRQGADISVQPATLHLRACGWFGQQGLLDEAVEQALRAGHLDVAANLVQNLSEEQLLAEQNVGMLLRWKMDLPDSLLVSTPRLIVLYSWALGLACQLDAAQALASHLGRFLPAPSATAQRSMLAQWLALSGIIARGRGDREKTLAYCTEALASLPNKRYGQRLMCLSTLSNLAIADTDFWRARALNRQSLELAQRVGNPLFEALAHYDRARVLQARGQISRALEEVRSGLARLQGLPVERLYAVRGRLTLYQGYLLTLCLKADEGRAHLQAGLVEARACRDISVLIGHCVLAALDGRDGHYPEAFAQLAEAERLMHIWDVPPVYYLAMITVFKCELWLAQGHLDLAEVWLLRLAQTYGGAQPAAAPEFHPQLPLHIELQRALLERLQGCPEQAQQRLRRLAEQGSDSGGHLLTAHALAQSVVLALEQGEENEACQLFAHTLQATLGGGLQPLHVLLNSHPVWVREQLLRRPPCPVQQALLKLLPEHARVPAVQGVNDPLSSRELAVLRLIALGHSNQEISEELFISLHTVKTHASHINGKLGVERRTQAVARAKTLGLLG
jgi:LuxR family maltose regulon positive regulatory protein